MKVLGITGGAGAGKSTVLNYLSGKYQARVIQADQVGHYLMAPGQTCYYKIVETFGSGILNGDQTIHRSKLAGVVFGQPERLALLNAIMHPAIKEYIIKEVEKERVRAEVPFVVIEAALLIEDHYEVICDEFWYIHAAAEVRKKRMIETRGYTAEKVESIMRNQLQQEDFLKHCQFVVDNSSDFIENTYEQIDKGLVEHGFM